MNVNSFTPFKLPFTTCDYRFAVSLKWKASTRNSECFGPFLSLETTWG